MSAKFKQFLEESIEKTINEYGEFRISDWGYTLLDYDNRFVDFPKVKAESDLDFEDDDQDSYYDESDEDLDFENFELLEVDMDDDSFIFNAGGDWQEPLEVLVNFTNKGKLQFKVLNTGEFSDGMKDDEFLEIVYGTDWKNVLTSKGYKV